MTYCGRFKALSEPGRPYTNANPICLDCASWLDDDELAESPYCDHPRRWCVRPDCKFAIQVHPAFRRWVLDGSTPAVGMGPRGVLSHFTL